MALVRDLRRRGMRLLLDVVPNHMSATAENPWWADLLESGRRSRYADWFDIDWSRSFESKGGKVVLPVLGGEYESILESGELTLALEEAGLAIRYHERVFPVDPATYDTVAKVCSNGRVRTLLERIAATARRPGADVSRLKRLLWRMSRTDASARAALSVVIRRHAGDRLDDLIGRQNYRLVHWHRAASEINYRRFFNITDLVCLRIEKPAVFAARHALLLRLVSSKDVSGVRIDHIDGLADPAGYLRRLRRRLGPGVWLLVEKILDAGEILPPGWPSEGTTGYDFLDHVTRLQVDPAGVRRLRDRAARALGPAVTFEKIAHDCKVRIARRHFIGEMRDMASWLRALDPARSAGISSGALSAAIIELTAALPVYRTYTAAGPPSPEDARIIRSALRRARRRGPDLGSAAWALLRETLVPPRRARRSPARERARREFVSRWQQFTGPIMAKGVEDTALYAWPGLLSLNEVGGNPSGGALPVASFHREMKGRLRRTPRALSATGTHDTKRGEDMRARISVLSEIADEWDRHVETWRRINRRAATKVEGTHVPREDEELFIYQTLIGSWPVDGRGLPGYRERLRQYLVKAAREAKRYTSWISTDTEHEEALVRFVDRILDDPPYAGFRRSFDELRARIGPAGAVNGLAQVILRNTAPGVPDLYQGAELWDQRLVDPDNRRPVDFERRRRILDRLRAADGAAGPSLAASLLDAWPDGRIKMFVTWKSLAARRARPNLFDRGRYVPIRTVGPRAGHLCCFARSLGPDWALVVAPLRVMGLAGRSGFPLGREAWAGTNLDLPRGAPPGWVDTLGGATRRAVATRGRLSLEVAGLLDTIPVALLLGRRTRG